MLEDHADDGAHAVDVALAVRQPPALGLAVAEQPALDEHPAFVVAVEERHASQKGALAGAGGADDADHLRPVDREVDSLEDVNRTEPLVQALDQDHGFAFRGAACRFVAHDVRPNRRSSLPPASATLSTISQ